MSSPTEKYENFTKEEFAELILQKRCSEINITIEDAIENPIFYSMKSTCLGKALLYLGHLKDKVSINYLSERAGIVDIIEDGKITHIITFDEIIKKLKK